nr:Gfo/Idh/MocA family oxidoreductase [uncultured Mediterraneibacter sp.]
MMKHRIGIVGCGGIAHQKHFPALKNAADRVELVAFCDLIRERAENAAKEFGAPGAKVYEDYHELLKDESIEIVYVLTPNVAHCPISVAAFEAGKHVLCEKPMAASVEDAEKMMEAWKKSGKMFTIGYQNRFRADSQTMKRMCNDGEMGEIYYAQAHALRRRGVPTWGVFTDKSQQGGGPLIDIGTHSLDLTLWLMDNYEPASVTGVTFDKLGKTLQPKNQGNFLGTWDPDTYEVEDAAFGFITMKDGSLITLDATWILNSTEERCASTYLCGTEAGAELTGVGGSNNLKLYLNKIMGGKQVKIDVDTSAGGVDFFDGDSTEPKDLECKTWLDAIEGKGELVVKPEQAFIVTKILDAIYKSAESGKQIVF